MTSHGHFCLIEKQSLNPGSLEAKTMQVPTVNTWANCTDSNKIIFIFILPASVVQQFYITAFCCLTMLPWHLRYLCHGTWDTCAMAPDIMIPWRLICLCHGAWYVCAMAPAILVSWRLIWLYHGAWYACAMAPDIIIPWRLRYLCHGKCMHVPWRLIYLYGAYMHAP